MFFIIEKKEETIFDFSKFCNCCLICIEMETQEKDPDNEFLQQENGTLLMTKIIDNMAEEMKMIQLLNLGQKLLNQIFLITQMHIFL